ncbi:MAG TPA: methylated-DNA--[protein]-cysteine S-methyltransferase [Haloplasmataceae bacterium]
MNHVMGTFRWKRWTFYVVKNERGICYVDVKKPDFPAIFSQEQVMGDIAAFLDYLHGVKQEIPVSLSIEGGTPFQQKVWQALLSIPYGATASYSEVARFIGMPNGVRAVGSAIGKNPILMAIPCHRVVGKDGSLRGFRSGIDLKRELLLLEKNRE